MNSQGEDISFRHRLANHSIFYDWEQPFVTFLQSAVGADSSQWTTKNAKPAGLHAQAFHKEFMKVMTMHQYRVLETLKNAYK